MKASGTVILLLAILTGSGHAQPKLSGKVQPDRIAFGKVHTGATVEASFVAFEAGKDAKIKFEVTAPKFVKVLRKSSDVHEYGPGNPFVRGVVDIAIDTTSAGEFSGDVAVTLGRTKAKVPVSAIVKPRRAGLLRLLVVETPFHNYSTENGAVFRAWTDLVNSSPWDVTYLLAGAGKPVLRDLDLDHFDTMLLGASALCHLTPEDVRRARAFAEAGGSVVMTANYFCRGTVPQANSVLEGYGLQMRDEEARGMGQNRATLSKAISTRRSSRPGSSRRTFFGRHRWRPRRPFAYEAQNSSMKVPAGGGTFFLPVPHLDLSPSTAHPPDRQDERDALPEHHGAYDSHASLRHRFVLEGGRNARDGKRLDRLRAVPDSCQRCCPHPRDGCQREQNPMRPPCTHKPTPIRCLLPTDDSSHGRTED
jgi:hypothetical protein